MQEVIHTLLNPLRRCVQLPRNTFIRVNLNYAFGVQITVCSDAVEDQSNDFEVFGFPVMQSTFSFTYVEILPVPTTSI